MIQFKHFSISKMNMGNDYNENITKALKEIKKG